MIVLSYLFVVFDIESTSVAVSHVVVPEYFEYCLCMLLNGSMFSDFGRQQRGDFY